MNILNETKEQLIERLDRNMVADHDLVVKLEELASQEVKTDQDKGYILAINDVLNYLKESEER